MTKQEAERKTGLCISRKAGDAVQIFTSDGMIEVQLVSVAKSRVRLRFEAPKKVRINRAEAITLMPDITEATALQYHGCLTGDCPHDKQSDCDAALLEAAEPVPHQLMVDASDQCICGHRRNEHIYYEGACRPGFVCTNECRQFLRKPSLS